MAKHEILVSVDDQFATKVNGDALRLLAARVLAVEAVAESELGILVTADERIQELNREYAGEDKPTDVLSFSLREGEAFVSPDKVERLGEVIISYETAERQADDAGHTVDAELAHLLVHGILHLLGYDHAAPDEERVMRAREEALLGMRH
jgi:probable rRNA maturation factor